MIQHTAYQPCVFWTRDFPECSVLEDFSVPGGRDGRRGGFIIHIPNDDVAVMFKLLYSDEYPIQRYDSLQDFVDEHCSMLYYRGIKYSDMAWDFDERTYMARFQREKAREYIHNHFGDN